VTQLEKVLDIVKSYTNGETLLLVVPKSAGVKRGSRFQVCLDEKTGELTYTPLENLNREKSKP